MLSNDEIKRICKRNKLQLDYCGYKDLMPSYKDTIRKQKYINFSGIINMDSSNPYDFNESGSHWVLCIMKNSNMLYFDSFGFIYPNEIYKFTKFQNANHLAYNTFQIQHIDDTHCGWYCIALLHYIKHNEGNINELTQNYINMFSEDTRKNANILIEYLSNNGINVK